MLTLHHSCLFVYRKCLPSVTFMRLDGSTPANSRHHVVNRFNDDPSIDLLLLTTTVGGLGLNLTGADTVIFVEHDWNPMKDLQVTAYLCGTTIISTKLQEWPLYMIFASTYADLDNGLIIRINYWYGSRFSLHTICRFFFFLLILTNFYTRSLLSPFFRQWIEHTESDRPG